MTDAKLDYLGPAPRVLTHSGEQKSSWKRLPVAFLGAVAAPTLLAAIYFLLIASPQYVSEARFIVRSPSQSQPSSLGVALQGVGLSQGTTDAYAVHEYIDSRDGLADLSRKYDLARFFGRGDVFSRYPRLWEGKSEEDLYEAVRRYVTVGYDSTTGISTLRVKAFTPQDAQAISETLLQGGEALVNRLNERAARDAISDARLSVEQARGRLMTAQQALTEFRTREQYIDPARAALESTQLIGGLLETLANLKAEREQIISQSPQSPQLPVVNARIAAFERQISAEREKVAGGQGSIAPKISTYEDLVRAREFADRELAQATAALLSAEGESRRQKLYLDRIVNPNRPDMAKEPKRLLSILTVLISCLLAYGVGWLVWAGVREHRQD